MSEDGQLRQNRRPMPVDEQAVAKGIRSVRYVNVIAGDSQEVEGEVVEEALVCISVNGQELATFMCSPFKLEQLALGFLYNEQLIASLDDVRSVHVSKSDSCVDIWLRDLSFERPERAIITAGCGGGITFDDLSQKHEPLHSTVTASPEQLAGLMRRMHLGASLYQKARGIHTAVLAEEDRILLQVEDVGRHNCLDRLAGEALMQAVDTTDRILMSSGRISSEMINKARRLQTPIVCSRTSPTALSVGLAQRWNITLVAYLRQNRMRIYSHPERLVAGRPERERVAIE
jgi:FdhD protein